MCVENAENWWKAHIEKGISPVMTSADEEWLNSLLSK
jgi:hypothetical protein